jgi:hypothetical protein
MSKADAWFPCYVNDLLGSMRWKRMNPAQRGAYWQLICWQMQSEDGHLDDDVGLLCALSDLDLSNGNKIVADAFPVDETGRRANPRALAEWAKRKAISGERREAGKKGMAKRWQGHNKPIASVTTSTSTSTEEHPEPQPPEGEISVPPTVRRKRTALLADDSEWMAEVKTRYAQIGIDAEREAVKAQAWLLGPKARGRKFTRQFFLNWLAKADGTIKAQKPKTYV